jgi:uncharacterized protein (DUF885 family)
LAKIDRQRLDREGRVLHALLTEELAVHSQLRVCHQEWWDVGHIGGWLSDVIDLAHIQPAGTPRLQSASVRRWSSLPQSVNTHIANINEGLTQGYAAPRVVVERTIAQLSALIDSPTIESPFYSPALRDHDPAFARKTRSIVEGPVRAALTRYRHYLQETYLPRSRGTLGLSELPNGPACLRARIRRYTSLDLSVEQLFAMAEHANDQGLLDALVAGSARYGTRDLAMLLSKARSDPAERYNSAAEMLEDSRATAEQARRAFAPQFLTIPTQALAVEPYPEGKRNLGLPPRYISSGNVSVPATTWVPDDRFASMPRGVMRRTILHEGIPGHHFVGARRAGRVVHPLLRLAYQPAFDEGWALYSEGLADTAGMAPSPAARVIAGINRSKGALFDLGIHGRGWDRAQLEHYFAGRGGLGQQVDDRLARIAAFPGQQLSYTSGELTILDLRAEAQRRLGPKFSLPAFHEAVLRDGGVPLWLLRENVEAWIAQQESGTR